MVILSAQNHIPEFQSMDVDSVASIFSNSISLCPCFPKWESRNVPWYHEQGFQGENVERRVDDLIAVFVDANDPCTEIRKYDMAWSESNY